MHMHASISRDRGWKKVKNYPFSPSLFCVFTNVIFSHHRHKKGPFPLSGMKGGRNDLCCICIVRPRMHMRLGALNECRFLYGAEKMSSGTPRGQCRAPVTTVRARDKNRSENIGQGVADPYCLLSRLFLQDELCRLNEDEQGRSPLLDFM